MMKTQPLLKCLTASVSVGLVTAAAHAAITADADLVLTFTLTDVVITDTLTDTSESAIFETSQEVGDVIFEDVGPNGGALAKGADTNPANSIGSASATETVSLNGLDVFEDDYDMDSFGIGDSVVITLNTFASATTPGSVFFGQAGGGLVLDTPALELYFSILGEETDQYSFFFDYEAEFSGTLDGTALPGTTLAFAEGLSVQGRAGSTLDGPESLFDVFDEPDLPYFNLGAVNHDQAIEPFNEQASGSFEVAFNPGDNDLGVLLDYSLIVNARVDVPEPSSLGLLALGSLVSLRRRRNHATG